MIGGTTSVTGLSITSSTDISASNIIATSNLTVLGTSSLNYFNPSTISASGDISTGANLFIVGNITASGNISASGDLVTRNITASGNISASGDIAGNTITVAGTNFINFQTSIVGTGYRINSGAGPLNILGNITASSNISASGHIIGERLTLGGTEITSTAAEINFLDGVLSTVKDAYDSVSYDGESGELTFTELDNNTDVIDLGIGILDSPTFKGVTLTTTDVTSHSWNSEADSNTKSFSFNTVVPLVGAGRSSDFQTVSNSQVSSTSIILASTSHTIPVLITHVIDSSFKFHFYNTTTSAISGTEVQINFTVI